LTIFPPNPFIPFNALPPPDLIPFITAGIAFLKAPAIALKIPFILFY